MIGTLHKWVSFIAPASALPGYQTCLYAVAALLSVGYVVYRRTRPTGREAWVGMSLGLLNAGLTVSIMLALGLLAAAIVFPVAACSIVALNAILGWRLWGERLAGWQIVGVALVPAIVVLVNLG